MNIPTHTSNVTRYSNFLISVSFKFRIVFFKYNTPILKLKQSINNQIHSHSTRTNNQMSILRVNRSKQNIVSFTIHGMITWNSFHDIFKVNVSFTIFKRKVRNFYLDKYQKILMMSATTIAFFPHEIHANAGFQV